MFVKRWSSAFEQHRTTHRVQVLMMVEHEDGVKRVLSTPNMLHVTNKKQEKGEKELGAAQLDNNPLIAIIDAQVTPQTQFVRDNKQGDRC